MSDPSKKEIVELVNMKLDGVMKEPADRTNSIFGQISEIVKRAVNGAKRLSGSGKNPR